MTSRVEYKAMNGDVVSIASEDVPLDAPVSGDIAFRDSRGGMYGFQTGPTGVGESHLTLGGVPDFAFSEAYGYSNGVLRIGTFSFDEEVDASRTADWAGDYHTLAEWSGPWHSVLVFMRVGHDNQIDVRSWFEGVAIEDSPDGALVRPKVPTEIDEIAVTKELPRLGTCRIRPIEQAAAMLPRWAGAPVRGGELYALRVDLDPSPNGERGATTEKPAQDVEQGHLNTLALVGESAFVEIAPPGEPDVSAAQQLALVENLLVEWSPNMHSEPTTMQAAGGLQ